MAHVREGQWRGAGGGVTKRSGWCEKRPSQRLRVVRSHEVSRWDSCGPWSVGVSLNSLCTRTKMHAGLRMQAPVTLLRRRYHKSCRAILQTKASSAAVPCVCAPRHPAHISIIAARVELETLFRYWCTRRYRRSRRDSTRMGRYGSERASWC